MGGEDFSIRPGIGDEQDESIQACVPFLEQGASLEGLQIAEARLGLDADVTFIGACPAIQRSKISGGRERYLGSPWEGRGQARPEPRKQAQLTCVSDGLANEVRADGQLEAHRRASERDLVEGRMFDFVSLQASQ